MRVCSLRFAVILISCLALVPAVGAQQSTPEAPPSFSVASDAAPSAKGSPGLEPATGSFTRAIPIEVPAFHGIEPRLVLAYSSQAGNGFVGVGWRLAG